MRNGWMIVADYFRDGIGDRNVYKSQMCESMSKVFILTQTELDQVRIEALRDALSCLSEYKALEEKTQDLLKQLRNGVDLMVKYEAIKKIKDL